MKWKGWIIRESLENDSILDKLKIINSIKEKNGEGDQLRVWNLNAVEVDDKEIKKVVSELQDSIKFGWYTHFTNHEKLLIIFRGKSFTIKIQKVLKETNTGATKFKAETKELEAWKNALEYGTKKGKVDPRYIVKVI